MQPDPSHPNAYFRDDFEQLLDGETGAYRAFSKLERQLGFLDAEGWQDLRVRAANLLEARIGGRGWQPLFDVFSEALGYGYLQSIGATNIRFIPPEPNIKTPDLAGKLNAETVFCEVKTINISEMEAGRRRRIQEGGPSVTNISMRVGDGLLGKLVSDLKCAVKQLDAKDPQRRARRFILTVVHFDDWVGDFQPEYFQQIDEHLLTNPIVECKLVFCPASNLFSHTFQMQSATIFDPEAMV
jgi:hypothetical protein